jgi:hypothetical protein
MPFHSSGEYSMVAAGPSTVHAQNTPFLGGAE